VLLNQCPHNLDLLQWIFGMRGYALPANLADIMISKSKTT
jgi:hypothetical protein